MCSRTRTAAARRPVEAREQLVELVGRLWDIMGKNLSGGCECASITLRGHRDWFKTEPPFPNDLSIMRIPICCFEPTSQVCTDQLMWRMHSNAVGNQSCFCVARMLSGHIPLALFLRFPQRPTLIWISSCLIWKLRLNPSILSKGGTTSI
jgi:hypothetical protein